MSAMHSKSASIAVRDIVIIPTFVKLYTADLPLPDSDDQNKTLPHANIIRPRFEPQ